MTLPIRDHILSTAVEGAMQKARVLRDNVQTWKTRVDSAPTEAVHIINAMQGIKAARDVLAAYVAVPGIDAYAKAQYDDANLALSTELTAIVTACDNCLSWVASNYPKDGSGYLLDRKVVGGQIEWRTFSVATLAGFSAQLGLLLAAFS